MDTHEQRAAGVAAAPYRIVTDGKAFKIQKQIEVGVLWWRRMEWVDLSSLIFLHLRPFFPTVYAEEVKARAALKELQEDYLRDKQWRPLANNS